MPVLMLHVLNATKDHAILNNDYSLNSDNQVDNEIDVENYWNFLY